MPALLKHLFSIDRVNWWILAGGMGLNFVIATVSSLLGAYWSLGETTSAFYASYGAPLMLLVVFLACLLAGALISRMAYEVPLRHAFLSGLGAVVPFIVAAALTLNIGLVMAAVVALAGSLNGAMLAQPKSHRPR
jgi:hypothetical protein